MAKTTQEKEKYYNHYVLVTWSNFSFAATWEYCVCIAV